MLVLLFFVNMWFIQNHPLIYDFLKLMVIGFILICIIQSKILQQSLTDFLRTFLGCSQHPC